MLRRVALALALVCAASVCSCAKADLMSRLIFPRDYGVKLCGREFIRAVIFTCGGSRWRRSPELGESGLCRFPPVDPRQRTHGRNPASEDPPPLGPSSLGDLLAVYGPGRRRRNFSLGVAGKCCTQGCTKNDIGRLC
uniref:Insulin n=1 Tax=Tetraodon nigroviridis TaxID=99883 RepID=B1AAR2_TETNG|nr:relaxin family locus B [Tetraodon nigroviridis]